MAFQTSDKVPLGANEVAVGLTHGLFGSHLGVAFHAKEDGAKLLHLANHHSLCVDPYGDKTWMVSVVPFELMEAIQFIALARNYAANHVGKDGPSYGVNLLAGKGAIDTKGNYNPSNDFDGFTCASIVAEIFNASGFEPVNLGNWETTDDNRIWGKAVVEMLRAGGASQDHVNAVSNSVNGLRLLPEEFAAATERPSDDWPTEQRSVAERATALTSEILIKCGPPIQIPDWHRLVKAVEIYKSTGRPSATIVPSIAKPVVGLAHPPSVTPIQTVSSATSPQQAARPYQDVGRNDPCPCKSGKKFKKCHGALR
jgi:hypothetical protein